MANAGKHTDGCEGKSMAAPQDKEAKLYDDLSKKNCSDALSIATDNVTFEYSLFTCFFPHCSGGEIVMAADTQQNGMILLTFAEGREKDTTLRLYF